MKETKSRYCSLLALGLAAMLPSCSKRESDTVALAEVDGTPITEEAFRHWWERKAPSTDNEATRQALMEELVERTALVNKAKELGLDKDPAVVAEIQSLLIARLKETQLQDNLANVSVSHEEAQAYYQNNTSEFTTAETYQVAVLWFNTRGQQELVDRYTPRLEKLVSTLSEVPASEGFGTQAITHSEHKESRFKGGKIGWLKAGSNYDALRQTALTLSSNLQQAGDVSPITANEHGLFVVRLLDKTDATPAPFSKVNDAIVRKLNREKRAQVQADFLQKHGTANSIQINETQLNNLSDLNLSTLSNR